jgi:hypothetical protein
MDDERAKSKNESAELWYTQAPNTEHVYTPGFKSAMVCSLNGTTVTERKRINVNGQQWATTPRSVFDELQRNASCCCHRHNGQNFKTK